MGKIIAREAQKSEKENKIWIKRIKNYIAIGDYGQAKFAGYYKIFSKNKARRYKILSNKIDLFITKIKKLVNRKY